MEGEKVKHKDTMDPDVPQFIQAKVNAYNMSDVSIWLGACLSIASGASPFQLCVIPALRILEEANWVWALESVGEDHWQDKTIGWSWSWTWAIGGSLSHSYPTVGAIFKDAALRDQCVVETTRDWI